MLWIDFGPLGIRKSSAPITDLYAVEDVSGRLVLAVVNLPPRQVDDFVSEVLVLVGPDREVSPGLRLL
jgi:tRNA-binding protein